MWLQIRTIDRKQEVPHDGAMCDLLWSDPGEQPDNAQADMTDRAYLSSLVALLHAGKYLAV